MELVEKKDGDRVIAINNWIQTYTGKKFYPLNPNIEDIDIIDIAHSLSNLCRFTGHSKHFYSISQHSVYVSLNCDPKDAMKALIHDASEYALQDIPSPLKYSGLFEEYKKFEKQLQSMIYRKYCGDDVEPESVKIADLRMLATEARDLMHPLHEDWKMPAEPFLFKIEPLSPKEAESLFLTRFNELMG
jgi:uncharacterized protein